MPLSRDRCLQAYTDVRMGTRTSAKLSARFVKVKSTLQYAFKRIQNVNTAKATIVIPLNWKTAKSFSD